MAARDHLRQDERETAASKTVTPEQAKPGPVELAGQIGNSNMQRVARSPALHGSPAAAGLIQRSTLARQSGVEKEAGGDEKAPDVTTPEAGPETGDDEQAPEASTTEGGPEEAAGEQQEAAAMAEGGVEKDPEGGDAEKGTTPEASVEKGLLPAPPPPAGPHGLKVDEEAA